MNSNLWRSASTTQARSRRSSPLSRSQRYYHVTVVSYVHTRPSIHHLQFRFICCLSCGFSIASSADTPLICILCCRRGLGLQFGTVGGLGAGTAPLAVTPLCAPRQRHPSVLPVLPGTARSSLPLQEALCPRAGPQVSLPFTYTTTLAVCCCCKVKILSCFRRCSHHSHSIT